MEESDRIIYENLNQHKETLSLLELKCIKQINDSASIISDCLKNNGTIFYCGNGGSASDAQHLSAELTGRYKKARKPLKSIALSTNQSAMTCIANDFNFNYIFAREIEALAKENDVLVAISTSAESKNILNALKLANEMNVQTILMTGNKNPSIASDIAKVSILVPSKVTARIQEMHILIGHILCELIEKKLGYE